MTFQADLAHIHDLAGTQPLFIFRLRHTYTLLDLIATTIELDTPNQRPPVLTIRTSPGAVIAIGTRGFRRGPAGNRFIA